MLNFKNFSILLLWLGVVSAFAPSLPSQAGQQREHAFVLKSTTTNDDSASAATLATTDKGLLKRDRYVATNRFAVRSGKAAKFEARWANRKSRLAVLEGFQYFHLMRRVNLVENEEDNVTDLVYDEGTDTESAQGNYVSFTIWNKKSHFSAWRKGEAFKEAHGGTSIGAFLGTMLNSLRVLRGAPRPAFYDGLILQKSIENAFIPETTEEGWRTTSSDGTSTLPTECFVACNQFFVPQENAVAFEQRWANRESKMKECEGFVAFTMLRRDGQAKGHGTVPMDESEPVSLI